MQELFTKHNFELSESELEKFQKFLEIFMETNAQINLSAIRDEAGIIEKHFVDSLYLAAFWDFERPVSWETGLKYKIADLGTGGGFP